MRSWGHGSARAAAWRAGRGCGSIAGHARCRRPVEPAPRLVASDHRGVHARRAALHSHSPLLAGHPVRVDRRLLGLEIQRHLHQPLAVRRLDRIHLHRYGKPQVPAILGTLQCNRLEHLRDQSLAASPGEVGTPFRGDSHVRGGIPSLCPKGWGWNQDELDDSDSPGGVSGLLMDVLSQFSRFPPVSSGSIHGLFSWHLHLGGRDNADRCETVGMGPIRGHEICPVPFRFHWPCSLEGSQCRGRAVAAACVRRLDCHRSKEDAKDHWSDTAHPRSCLLDLSCVRFFREQ